MFAIQNPDNTFLDLFDFLEYPYTRIFKRTFYNKSFDIYTKIQKAILNDVSPKMFPICFLSCDTSISAATISGFVEKYSQVDSRSNITSNLHVVYINKKFNMDEVTEDCTYTDFHKIVLSNVLGMNAETFTKHKINLIPHNLHCIGTTESSTLQKRIKYKNYSLENIKKRGIIKVVSDLVKNIKGAYVYIALDIDAIDFTFAPSSTRTSKDGLDLDELYAIIDAIKINSILCGIDINGFYFGKRTERLQYEMSNQLTCVTINNLISRITNKSYEKNELKMSKILDNELIIWKKNVDNDWKLFNAMSDEVFDELINKLNEKNNLEIDINNDNDDNDNNSTYKATLSSTTIGEQLKLSYYDYDTKFKSLLPNEKKIAIRYFLIKHGKSK